MNLLPISSITSTTDKEHFFVTERHTEQNKKSQKSQKENFFRRGGKLTNGDGITYATFLEIYKLWLEYFNNIMGNGTFKADERLLKLDYHGCLLLVTHSKNKSHIGIHGFVVNESRQTFQLITKKDKLKIIPKQGTIFQFVVNKKIYVLFGNAMQQKSFARGKKPKMVGEIPFLICR
uniref:Ribonuclease P protein subunit p29 n=1 Tax=Parastrongyloides trichosuri TaxID=131310 RepID=A0A0N4ZUE7_PARTI